MRDQLLKFLAVREEAIEIDGVAYVVRELSEADNGEFFADGKDALYKFIVRSVFDAEGNRAFADEDVEALKAAGKLRLRRLTTVVMRVNGLDAEAEIKNSDAGPSAG